MRRLDIIRLRMRSLLRRSQAESELQEEIRYHLERETDERVKQGARPDEAHYGALKSISNIEQRKEECRDMRGLHVIENLTKDLRYAGRQLLRTPAFTLTIVVTLALCIGANTAIFSIVDALFFKPLPYRDPSRLVLLTTVYRQGGAFDVDTRQDGSQAEMIRQNAPLLDSAVYGGSAGVNLVAGNRVEYVIDQRVSANYFHVLGIDPVIGREFTVSEDVAHGPQLAILSYGLWRRVFHGDPAIVGKAVDLRGSPHTVVGIMPAGFRSVYSGGSDIGGMGAADVWTPLHPSRDGEGSGTNYAVIGRLKPGVTNAQASGQVNAVLHDYFAKRHFPADVSVEEKALPLQAGLTSDIRSGVNLMWSAVLLVLVIGCVNIAGMLLAQSANRSRELATRLALGAGRGRVISQLLAESLLLSLVGGVFGLAVGYAALEGMVQLNPGEFNMFGSVHLDFRVMAVMLSVSVATSFLFGLVPAFDATRVDLRSSLAEGSRGSTGGRQWKRQALVFAEIALGVTLIVAAGLLIRTFALLVNADPGFDPKHLIVASASMQDARYATTAAGSRLFRQSLDRIRAIPGVESAAVALTAPYASALNEGVTVVGSGKSGITNCTYVIASVFETLRMHLLRGRLFNDADRTESARVAIVNERFVQRYFPQTTDPTGALIRLEDHSWQIVGVVNNTQVKMGWGGAGPVDYFPGVYVPVEQYPDGSFAGVNVWYSPVWLVRTRGTIPSLAESMQRALRSVDPQLPFSSFQSVEQVRGESLAQQRYQATLFLGLSALTVLLVAIGIYGLIATSVAQRTREFGIRLALGATSSEIICSAVAPGLLLALGGIATGTLLAFFAMRLLKSLIWGVSGTDPLTFVTVTMLELAVAAVASLIPALCLVHIDPAKTLRNE